MASSPASFGADRLALIATLEETHFWFRARQVLVDRLIALAGLPPASSVLDVGCGTGAYAARLASRGHHVVALDLRPEGLQRLRAVMPASRQARADATALPLRDNTFDLVLALDVVEHTDDAAALREIRRVVRPGGAAVVTVPALPSLWSARDVEAGHRRRYTQRSFRDAITSAGLHPVAIEFYQCLLLPVVAATRLAGKFWRGAQHTEERPYGFVNNLCLAVNRVELALGTFVRWPAGSSLAALVTRPA